MPSWKNSRTFAKAIPKKQDLFPKPKSPSYFLTRMETLPESSTKTEKEKPSKSTDKYSFSKLLILKVIIATGGFGADFSNNSYLKQYRPDIMHLPTTSNEYIFSDGDHCDGSGIRFSQQVGAEVVDMEWVQVHPTGLVTSLFFI